MKYPDGYDPLSPTREIIFRAWTDNTFKQRLLTEPLAVMKEYGAQIPESVKTVVIVENSRDSVYFILPMQPESTKNVDDDVINEKIDSMLLTQLVFPTVLAVE